MDDKRTAALLALSLAEGVAEGDLSAFDMVLDTFDSLEEAAAAHAYLAGYLIEVLAAQRDEPTGETARYVRRLLKA